MAECAVYGEDTPAKIWEKLVSQRKVFSEGLALHLVFDLTAAKITWQNVARLSGRQTCDTYA